MKKTLYFIYLIRLILCDIYSFGIHNIDDESFFTHTILKIDIIIIVKLLRGLLLILIG
jgi:hypothetical protein